MSRIPINHPVSAWATETINEICEDIALVGAKTTAYLILNDKGEIIDYEVENAALNDGETAEAMPLFNVLCSFVAAQKNTFYGRSFSPRSLWVTAARLAANLKREDFAKECGVPCSTLSAWEQGARTPKLDNLFIIARKFNLPTDFII